MAVHKYTAPNGNAIVSILETVLCGAAIEGISEDGETVEYAGSTNVYWDEQKPVLRGAKPHFVFLDEAGDEYTFEQLTKGDAIPAAEDLEIPE